MLVEPVTIAGKNIAQPAQERLGGENIAQPAQERLPAENEVPPAQERLRAEMPTPQESVKNAKPEDESDLSGMTQAVADIQEDLNVIHNVDLQFTVHEDSGRIMVTVRDQSTGEVIREIPPAEILDLAARFGEMVGLLFDGRG
jgi:uncharacterized FlaG/YvyC family protein